MSAHVLDRNYKNRHTCTVAELAAMPNGDLTVSPIQFLVNVFALEWTIEQVIKNSERHIVRLAHPNYVEDDDDADDTRVWFAMDEILQGATS